MIRATAIVVVAKVGATVVVPVAIAGLAVLAARADLAARVVLAARAGPVDPARAANSASIVQADATATVARPVGKRRALAPDGCCPARPIMAASTPKMRMRLVMVAHQEIAARREIGAHQGSRASITAGHDRPRVTVHPTAHGRKARKALQAQGRVRAARAGGTDSPSDLGPRMVAQGQQAHGRRAMEVAASDQGGRMVAMVVRAAVRAAAMVVLATSAIGPVRGAEDGTSPPCRKSPTSQLRLPHPAHRP